MKEGFGRGLTQITADKRLTQTTPIQFHICVHLRSSAADFMLFLSLRPLWQTPITETAQRTLLGRSQIFHRNTSLETA